MADETKLTAATRLEKLLDNIAGGDNEVTPATRLEKFLSYIADAMEGGGGSGGDFPVYEIKALPEAVGTGQYIDGDPAEIFRGPCMLVDNALTYIPVMMFHVEDYYSLTFISSTGETGGAIATSYSTGQFEDPDYENKLCLNTGSGPK